jgi:exosome complex exonuclease DIS3/RRP44
MEGIYTRKDNKDFIITSNNKIEITDKVSKMKKPILIGSKIINIENTKDIKIIEESKDLIFGILSLSSKVTYGSTKSGGTRRKFIPYNSNYPEFIVGSNKSSQPYDIYASIKFDKWEVNIPVGSIYEYYGELGDIKAESIFFEKYAMSSWKRNFVFNEQDYLEDLTPKRQNITDKYIISIDPDGCIDIDDAFHIIKNNNTNIYEVGIHIADVTSFIKENSYLDKEIQKRSESIYLKNKQINMIPDILSIDYMSLKKNKNSRAYSLILKIKEDGNIIDYNFIKSTIKVKENLSYEEADKILKDEKNNNLQELYKLMIKVQKNRKSSTLTEIITEDKNKYDSHKLVEV